MFTMANEFRNLNITDNFVYSYHDKMPATTVMDSEKIYERAFVSHSIKFRPETFKRGPQIRHEHHGTPPTVTVPSTK